MKLYYDDQSEEVYYAVYDRDIFDFSHTTNIPLLEFNIDEINGNELTCIDLKRTECKFNDSGQKKYYIENGELYNRDGWIEYIIPPEIIV